MEHIFKDCSKHNHKFEGNAENTVYCLNHLFVTNFAVCSYSLQFLAWIDFIFRAEVTTCSQVKLCSLIFQYKSSVFMKEPLAQFVLLRDIQFFVKMLSYRGLL